MIQTWNNSKHIETLGMMKINKHNFNHALKFIAYITVIRWLQIQWKKNKLIIDQIRGQA